MSFKTSEIQSTTDIPQQNGEKRRRTGTDGTHTFEVSSSGESFPIDLLPQDVQIMILRKLDIPDAVNARLISRAFSKSAADSRVWQFNADYIGFPMSSHLTDTMIRLIGLVRGLRESAKDIENEEIENIFCKDTLTLSDIRFLASKLQVKLDQTDYDLIKSHVKELWKMAATVNERPAEITEILKVDVPSIAQIRLLENWIYARAVLIIWKEVIKLVCNSPLREQYLNKIEESEQSCKKMCILAPQFAPWYKNIHNFFVNSLCLDLSNKNLLRIPDEIGCLGATIYEMRLENNQLRSLPGSMVNLTSLRYLYLDQNRFTSVPEVIAKLHLQELFLRHNQITSLPTWLDTFLDAAEFEALDLDFDHLSLIPPDFYKKHVIVTIPNVGILIRSGVDALPMNFNKYRYWPVIENPV